MAGAGGGRHPPGPTSRRLTPRWVQGTDTVAGVCACGVAAPVGRGRRVAPAYGWPGDGAAGAVRTGPERDGGGDLAVRSGKSGGSWIGPGNRSTRRPVSGRVAGTRESCSPSVPLANPGPSMVNHGAPWHLFGCR